jgi:glycosyltransferase involved in cell wall biosynthesis
MMRILCVMDNLESGGAQRQMSLLVCGLKERGHHVELLLYHPGRNHFRSIVEAAGIRIHEVARQSGSGFSLRVVKELRAHAASEMDAVISFQPTANIYAAITCVLFPRRRFRLICAERSSSKDGRRVVVRLLGWLSALAATSVVANSYTEASRLRRTAGLARKVSVIWNGFRIEEAHYNVQHSLQRPLRLLVVGRLSKEKNGLRLLHALKILHGRLQTAPELRWAGRIPSGTEDQQVHNQMIEFLNRNPAIGDRVLWLGEVNDVHALYASSDLLVLPSLYEGLPNAVCEAMLAGCPVLASHTCDHPRLLGEHGERGLLCDPYSVESIADAIQHFQSMSLTERDGIALRARQFAEAHLSIDRMVDAYEKLLIGRVALEEVVP